MTEYTHFKSLCKNGKIKFSNTQMTQHWFSVFSSRGLELSMVENSLILNSNIIPLDKRQITNFLADSSRYLSDLITITYQTTSTNNQIQHKDSSQILIAEFQSAGKGRRERNWISPAGQNIYLSIKYTNFNSDNISFLPIYISLIIAELLNKAGIKGLTVKWPNDLYLYGKKFSGSLLEMISLQNNNLLIYGIGINVSMPVNHHPDIDQPYASISQYYNNSQLCNRNYLIATILPALYNCLDTFNGSEIPQYLKRFDKFNLLKGHELLIKERDRKYSASYSSINEDGSLRVIKEDKFSDLYAGDVSVRLGNA